MKKHGGTLPHLAWSRRLENEQGEPAGGGKKPVPEPIPQEKKGEKLA